MVLALMLCGCGGSSSSNNATPQMSIQSGNWSILATSASDPTNPFGIGGSLSQSGSTISGVVHVVNSASCFNLNDDIPLSGTVSGQSVTLTSPVVDGAVLTVNASGSSNALSGTYTVTVSNTTSVTCVGGNDQGTFSANLVPSLGGSWQGTLTSDIGGPTLSLTANITQSATPDAHGFFPVSGTVTFSGSTCFTSGDFASTPAESHLAGSFLFTNISTNDQPTPGVLVLDAGVDAPTTANSLSAIYDISSGNCSGDGGTGHLTKQ